MRNIFISMNQCFMKLLAITGITFWIVALAPSNARAAFLTGVMVFSCDTDGNPDGDFVWDTRGSDSDFYKLWLTSGSPGAGQDGFTGAFINGPDWAQAPINLPLENGPNRFTLFFEHNGAWPHFGINLFFDSNAVPAISAKAPLRTERALPHFSANKAPLTYSMTSYPSPDAPAAGRTFVRLDKFVNLAAYSVAEPGIVALDRVNTHEVGASGRNDFIGNFTLNVQPRRLPPKAQWHDRWTGQQLMKRDAKGD